jgi:hypothetical protein
MFEMGAGGVPGTAETATRFGATVAAGDFDGDGPADLAIGAPSDDLGAMPDAGSVVVLRGGGSGLTATGAQHWTQDTTGVIDSAELDDGFGSALASANFGRGGESDLAIGVPGETVNGQQGAGMVNVLYGGVSGLSSSGNTARDQDTSGVLGDAGVGDSFGYALAAGELNGDGQYADLAVGVPGETVGGDAVAGATAVLYGSETGITVTDQLWSQDSSGIEDLGEPFDFLGGNLQIGAYGYGQGADLAMGVFLEDRGSVTDAGSVNLIFSGGAGGLASANDQLWHQLQPDVPDTVEANDHFGGGL